MYPTSYSDSRALIVLLLIEMAADPSAVSVVSQLLNELELGKYPLTKRCWHKAAFEDEEIRFCEILSFTDYNHQSLS